MVNRLLRHPVPFINESIGNYVLRLCSENSCEIKHISDLIGLKWKRSGDYYRKLKDENIIKFSDLTGIDVKVIEDMTVSRFRFQNYIDYGFCTEACVCPKCYSEISYERIHWKNKLIKVCLDHKIYLVDECPNCKKRITSKILFNGKCDCGLLINDFKYAKCANEYILQSQNILYQIFNIKSRVPLKECDFLYNSILSKDYCHLLYHLQYLATRYEEDFNDLGFFSDNDGYLNSNIIAAWIMFDWPANLITFLNILNCLDIKYINRSSFEVDGEWWEYSNLIEDRFMRIFNPLQCLELRRIPSLVKSYKEIYQPLMIYYYENSNKEKVKMKMNKYIYLNDYVEFEIAIIIFFDTHNSDNTIKEFVKDYFHIYNFFNKEYIYLEEIFDFYNIIKRN